MNEATWQNAEVSEVFIASGKFDGDQRRRWRPAPFQIIELDGVTYLQTAGTEARMEDVMLSDNGVADLQMRIGFGFLRAPLYVEDSQIGGANSDSILAVHGFSQ